MALILRIAASLDRRPDPAIASLDVSVKSSELIIGLVPEKAGQNLGLEEWSLKSCSQIIKELTNLDLKIIIK